jgi:serine/threonine protein phosphatase PrpC
MDDPMTMTTTPTTTTSSTLVVAADTDKGQVRANNEDSVLVEQPTSADAQRRGTLGLVADGMGGAAAGEVASQLAAETVHDFFYQSPNGSTGEALGEAIRAANARIWNQANQHEEQAGMGSTLTAVVVSDDNVTIGHVGDSRAYLVRKGSITQLTQDHSWVAEQVAAHILTPEEAEHHPRRNVITRALGQKSSVDVDVFTRRIRDGDSLLLCSDGLTRVVQDIEIEEEVSRSQPREAVKRLIDLANKRGAPDNVSVAILRRASARRMPAYALILAFVVVYALGGVSGAVLDRSVWTPAAATLVPTLSPTPIPPTVSAAPTAQPAPTPAPEGGGTP